ncbi:FAD/NAD(P)-binding protein [Microbacterium testaceum]|uniref:hypothetical protein n=1 Tax=Microbacterium testaceum TaxID=2033 RepID=UPI002AC3EF68|nr:hypothetical protein [Microbacterium testaceum]MDZ5146349.1 hypothetical protein [Microbacterium testaceum]
MLTDGHYEVAIIGGGFRATALLAASPELRARRVAVIERRGNLGGGDMHDYWTTSTSAGDRFVKDADLSLTAFHDEAVRAVTTSPEPVMLPVLAAALDTIGQSVLNAGTHLSLVPIEAHEVQIGGPFNRVKLSNGEEITTAHVVLATGRQELLAEELVPFRDKVVLSGKFLAQAEPVLVRRALEGQGPIVIAGCAHSSMSALREILRRRDAGDVRYIDREIIVVRRSAPRLYYPNLERAVREQRAGRERLTDPRSICRLTGAVHRDSGLRGESREIYLRLWAGRIPHARLFDIDHLMDATVELTRSALIVQALGYVGRAPLITDADGTTIRDPSARSRLAATADGRALIHGRPSGQLSILRVDPTPPHLRDHAGYGQGLNRQMADRVLRQLKKGEE